MAELDTAALVTLDPQPYYVPEADVNDEGPESGAGRYTTAQYWESALAGEHGGIVYNLATFAPRRGYAQDEEDYR